MIQVREATRNDANDLLDLDIKCHDYPWSPEAWSDWLAASEDERDTKVYVATFYGNAIGFAASQIANENATRIYKLAVLPRYRRQHVSMLLLAQVSNFALSGKDETNLWVLIPETDVLYGAAGKWARSLGFKATLPFIKDAYEAYGTKEDGIYFNARIRKTNE